MQSTRQSGGGRVRLGELLVKAGVITDAQLKTALQEQRRWGGKLGDILVRMRYLSEDVFVRALSKQMGLPRADLSGQQPIPPEALGRVPANVAEEYEIVPCALADEGKTLGIATSDPLNLMVLDAIRVIAQCRVVPYIAGASQIRAAIARLYQGEETPPADAGQLRILGNGEDMTAAQASENQSRAALAPPPRPPTPEPPQPDLQQLFPPAPAASAYGYAPAGYAPAYAPAPVVEESSRREAAAIRALVELLVQKGVITLDEYLARLKR